MNYYGKKDWNKLDYDNEIIKCKTIDDVIEKMDWLNN